MRDPVDTGYGRRPVMRVGLASLYLWVAHRVHSSMATQAHLHRPWSLPKPWGCSWSALSGRRAWLHGHALLLGLLLGGATMVVAGQSKPEAGDERATLVREVRGYTPVMQGSARRFHSLLIAGGRVVALNPSTELLRAYPDLEVVEGAGHTLLPGLIDAHGHVESLGMARLQADVAGLDSLAATVEAIARHAAANPDLPWILGRGWNQELWQDVSRMPMATDLRTIDDARPLWLGRVDGHAGWANDAALRLAGITEATEDPPGGYLLRDARGRPTGVLVDAAMALVERVVPPPDAAMRRRALLLAQRDLLAAGLTAVHDAGVDTDVLAQYRQLADAGELELRVYAMLAGMETLGKHPEPFRTGRLVVRSVKLYADGALGSRGAALLEPYADAGKQMGLLFHSQAELADMIREINERGFQACIHAIGTLANREVLRALAEAQGGAPSRHRNRIEHAQIVHPDDFVHFAPLGVIASVQPTHATSDWRMAIKRLDRRRLAGAYPWVSLLSHDARLALGSDFPVESENPLFGIHAAITRQDRDLRPPGGWLPGEILSLPETLRGFTLDAAYSAHAENEIGSLEPGKYADFVLLEGDLFGLARHAPDTLRKVRVLETWIEGRRVHVAR